MTSTAVLRALNSEHFLRDLVALKDTENATYRTTTTTTRPSIAGTGPRKVNALSEDDANDDVVVTSCEYTGKLWFLRKAGLRFRETVTVVAATGEGDDGVAIVARCDSELRKNGKWIKCSSTTCTVGNDPTRDDAKENEDGGAFAFVVKSELSVKLPLRGVSSAVVKKINVTFQKAIKMFLEKQYNVMRDRVRFT